MTKPLISLFLVLTVLGASNGTTLVAFRNSNQVVLAADSRYSRLSTHEELFRGNKIKPCGNYFVAIAGLYTVRLGNSVDDLSKVTLACKAGQTPLESINALMTELETTYIRLLLMLKQAKAFLPLTKSGYQSSELELNLILVGNYKGVPFILVRNLAPAFEGEEVVVHSERPWTLMSKLSLGQTQYAFGGVYSELNSYARQNNLDQPRVRLVETARDLVDYQINRTPELSNYPINIVSVNAQGKVSWLSCSPTCQVPKPNNLPLRKVRKATSPKVSGKSGG